MNGLKKWFEPKGWIKVLIAGLTAYIIVGLLVERFNINNVIAAIIYFPLGMFLLALINSLAGAYRLTRLVNNMEGITYKKEKYNTIEDFEATIKKHEDQLFGIHLYCKEIKYLYSHDKNILNTTEYHFRNIMQRGEKTISEAKELSEKVKSGTEDIKALKKFKFPPIHGPGLNKMTQRATLLAQTYKELFPGRPQERPLTEDERYLLLETATNKWNP
jgi:hypothetical protein